MSSRGGRKAFSAHRCPEADLLPETQAPPTLGSELTWGPAYLDVLSKEEEDEGSLSDWSEEDLSLHFSPSVILPSDNEESDPESGFGCVDVTMETQVRKREGGDPKMVPKRQIQLRKKEEDDIINQVMLSHGSADGEKGLHHRHDLLLRQHSVPASFHTGGADNHRFYRGLVAGASQGLPVGGNSRHLQKSLSLDETKTKMASCIIKNVLSKKMQVEQSNGPTNHLKKTSEVPPAPGVALPQPAGAGVLRAPVHSVRDVRSLVKHTYSHDGPASFKMIGSEESPPPTYQQAVGIKGPVAIVTASSSKPQTEKQSDAVRWQRRRGSEPIITRAGDITCPGRTLSPAPTLTELSQSGRSATSIRPPPPRKPAAREQSSLRGESAQVQVLHPWFYTHTALHPFPPGLHPHLGTASFVLGPLSYLPPASTLHLDQNGSTESSSDQPDWARTSGEGGGRGHSQPVEQQPHLLLFDPRSGRSFYLDTPQPRRKMLLDPETGRFIQVLLPAPSSTFLPVHYANTPPTVLHVGGANPTVLSVMAVSPSP
ncbi:uncharacterized protein PAE49_018536 [Odontesthes bonariensis]|uniref:uncharacterized protein LOC142401602 n=1 Tax=Odontesthes bonariensis TaxID=219752 RepID=UPI003F589636